MNYKICDGRHSYPRDCKQEEFSNVVTSAIASHVPFEVSYFENNDTQLVDTNVHKEYIITKNKDYVDR